MKKLFLALLLASASVQALAAGTPSLGSITIQDTGSATAAGATTGTPTTGSVVVLALNGAPSAGIQLGGTFTGTINFECSMDGTLTWRVTNNLPLGSSSRVNTGVTAIAGVTINTIGCTHARARATAAMTGAATVWIVPGSAAAP